MTTSDDKNRKSVKESIAKLLLIACGALGGVWGAHLVYAQPGNLSLKIEPELIPLYQVEPNYPATALSEKIEGWVQVIFTVTAAGTVDPNSIEVVDSEPSEIFNGSAMQAISQFTFSPRIHDGVAVDLPNVQHVFRYELDSKEVLAP